MLIGGGILYPEQGFLLSPGTISTDPKMLELTTKHSREPLSRSTKVHMTIFLHHAFLLPTSGAKVVLAEFKIERWQMVGSTKQVAA
jgi:hypothetical protein